MAPTDKNNQNFIVNLFRKSTPILTFERLLLSYFNVAPKGLRSWLKAMPLWLGQKLHIPKIIRKEIGYKGNVLFTEHHEAHAASAFFPSPFSEAAILTIDGVGEWATASYGYGTGSEINLLKELHFPNSVGLLYSAFTYFTGFRVNSGEYKMMGLSPYGEPIYKDLILNELIDLKSDGSIRLNLKYFDFLGGLKMTNRHFAELFGGPPREPESEISKREIDMAASIQKVTEEIVLRMARHLYHETHQKYLCMAGGVALNCVANGRLLREGPFDDIWIQPAAGDAGGALGAAFAVWHRYLGHQRNHYNARNAQRSAFLGPSYSKDYIEGFLNRNDYPYHPLSAETRSCNIAEKIAEGKIVGYFAGRMEYGPRALGARSILGDPRNDDTQAVMNQKIKYRESFRPFAPTVLEEKAKDFFKLDRASPYMLLVAKVQAKRCLPQSKNPELNLSERLRFRRSDIPAVTHLDYSARIQTVNQNDKPDYYVLIREFEKLTGYAVLVNTSFNVRGEPIVCSPEDAYRCFMRTEMDALILEDYMLNKDEQPPITKVNIDTINSSPVEMREIYRFGLIALLFFSILASLAIWREKWVLVVIFGSMTTTGFGFMLLPKTLQPLYRKWLKIAHIIGEVINTVILTIVYYIVITPTSYLKHLFGGRPLPVQPVLISGIN